MWLLWLGCRLLCVGVFWCLFFFFFPSCLQCSSFEYHNERERETMGFPLSSRWKDWGRQTAQNHCLSQPRQLRLRKSVVLWKKEAPYKPVTGELWHTSVLGFFSSCVYYRKSIFRRKRMRPLLSEKKSANSLIRKIPLNRACCCFCALLIPTCWGFE